MSKAEAESKAMEESEHRSKKEAAEHKTPKESSSATMPTLLPKKLTPSSNSGQGSSSSLPKTPLVLTKLTIVDWDDTIFATTAIKSAGGHLRQDQLDKKHLQDLHESSRDFLKTLKTLGGHLTIVTNAQGGWVEKNAPRTSCLPWP